MLFLENFQRFCLYFIFWQFKIYYVTTAWPSSNSSNIQLLGLFEDEAHASEPTKMSAHYRAMFKAAVLLSQQYNITIEGQFIEWQSVQTDGDVIVTLSDACQAISASNIAGIIGPDTSREAHILAPYAKTVGIPVVSYAASDPDLSDRNAYPAFYRTVPSDSAAASAILKLFIRFNWTSCIIIYQNDAFGSGGAKVISEGFINNGLIVREMIVFDIVARRIRGNLKNLLTNSATRIVILWTESTYTSEILQEALDSDVLGPLFTWILSSSISLDSFNQTFHQNLIGMLTVEPVIATVVNAPINTTLLNAAYNIWEQYEPETFPGPEGVDYYAFFAFDATWLLIQALKQLCSETINSSSSCFSFTGSSYCFNRRFVHSNLLFDIVSNTTFLGVSGPIQFNTNATDRVNGSYYYAQNVQHSSNGLQFVPILAYCDPGYWKPYTGESIIVWPGYSLIPPTGIAILQGVTLRIGVIKATPFTIVTNEIDASGKNKTTLTGYVPDLIELLQTQMGFIPNIQIAPFNQTYNQVIQAVANGVYDIVVGDVTITSTRRKLVGFSASIFDNSLRIVMRKTPDVKIDLTAFLQPFTVNLWFLILLACIYAGILICLIERQDNEALKDRSMVSQFTMSMWYSFSNMVGFGADFVASTAAGRLLTAGLYIFCLVLVASYTANLVSNLTTLKAKSIIYGIDDIKKGKIPPNRIGILVSAPSETYYLKEISDGLRNYHPLQYRQQTYERLLAGIIDVAFVDVGIAEYLTNNIYCNLTLIGDGFDNSAFGIVTPKNWLYAQDLDVNILKLIESGSLDNLVQKWFRTKICPDLTGGTSASMGVTSIVGLFLTFGVISVLSLLLFAWIKRQQIKNYLFTLVGRKKSSSKENYSMEDNPIKTSERSQVYQFSSPDKVEYF